MFGVSWLNADRITDYLSTSSMIVKELFTSTNKPSRGQKEKGWRSEPSRHSARTSVFAYCLSALQPRY